MESTTNEVEVEIGDVIYSFIILFYYNPGIRSNDPTEGSDTELISHEISDFIHANNHETGEEWIVTSIDEINRVMNEIDVYDEFEKAIS